MANGFCPSILRHIRDIGVTNPETKIPNLGFLQMLLCCMDGTMGLSDGYDRGHNRNVNIWYRDRIPTSAVQDSAASCETGITRARKEFTLPSLLTDSIGIFFDDSLIRQYCVDASDKKRVPGSTTDFMAEVWDGIIAGVSALLRRMDQRLITQMSTQFGVNVTTGSSDAKKLNTDPNDPYFKQILMKLITDFRKNEFCENPCIVGNGDFANFETIRRIFGDLDRQGINPSKLASLMPTVYEDGYTEDAWGENMFGVFEKGSLGLITYPQYVGSFAGRRGNSDFFSFPVPTNEYTCPQQCLDALTFDMQIRELDCKQTVDVGGVETEVGPGVHVMISKQYSLFVKPDSLYVTGDPLAGTNGTLLYEISESVTPPDNGSGDGE